jgi:lipopolysaccharide export system permease protein
VIISRYLTREVVNALFIIITVLMLAFLSQQIVRYLNYVAIGKISTNVLLSLIAFEIPYLFALLLPLGLYLSILFVYGRLYSDHEILMMQMGGFHYYYLIRLTGFIAAITMAIVLFLMLSVNPIISTKRQQMMTSHEATLHLIQTLIPGRFQTSPDDKHVMYVEKLSRDHQRAENVFLAQETKMEEQPDTGRWTLFLANEGYQVQDKVTKNQFFVLVKGFRYEGVPGQNDYKITQFKTYSIRIPQMDGRANHPEVEAQQTSLLWHNYDQPKQAAELQWRISIGLSAFLLALLAVPFSAIRPRQGRYLIFLPAILVYIFYINLLIVARRWLEQGSVSILVGLWWVHILMLCCIVLALAIKLKWVR